MKIIHILPHSMSNVFPDYSLKNENYFKFYEGGWHVRTSKQIFKISNLDIECWGMEKTIDKPVIFERDDINYKVFPSRNFKLIGEVSLPLLKELKLETENNNVIIHIHGV